MYVEFIYICDCADSEIFLAVCWRACVRVSAVPFDLVPPFNGNTTMETRLSAWRQARAYLFSTGGMCLHEYTIKCIFESIAFRN